MLNRLLEELDLKTPDEIAQYFMRLGIKGDRGKCDTCPVAHYLTDNLNTNAIVMSSLAATTEDVCDLPPNVRQFVNDFDQGVYPGLTC